MKKSTDKIPTKLGENLRRLRESSKLTQQELCDLAKVTSVAMIESGERKSPHYTTISRIARALGVSPDDLLGEHRELSIVPDALAEFLDSTAGADVSDDEQAELMKVATRWKCRATFDTYYLALKMLRSVKNEAKQEAPDKGENDEC